MSETPGFLAYEPAGPTIAAFHLCDDIGRFVAGPVGSGKTGGLLNEILYRARAQAPHPADGVRRTRWGVVRDSYRELEKTTILSWHQWVPKDWGHFVGGTGGAPATHTFGFKLPDGTTCHIQVQFVGLGDKAAEFVVPGWEITGAYLNEMNNLSWDTVMYVKERIRRYPKVDTRAGFAGATWAGIWGDFNKPDTDHWLYDNLVAHPQDGFRLFDQPGAMVEVDGRWVLNPRAENLPNLPPGYYEQQLVGAERWRIRQRIANIWTASRDGQAVYEEYNDELHLSPAPLAPIDGIGLTIGVDAGLDPAAAICQHMPTGQWRVLSEVVSDHGTGAERFARTLRQHLNDAYAPWLKNPRGIRIWADPAAGYGADKAAGEATWIQKVAQQLGVPILPAPSNRTLPRWEAVRRPLSRMIDGQPGFVLSSSCRVLRRGFNGRYRFRRRHLPGLSQFSDEADKNEASHVHDALQYACLGGGEWTDMRSAANPDAPPEPAGHVSDYDPYAVPTEAESA